MIVVIALMRAKKSREKELEEVLRGMVAPTRKEGGCLQYDLNVSLSDPGAFVFYERWRDQSDLDRHLETQHIVSGLARAEPLLDGQLDLLICRLVE